MSSLPKVRVSHPHVLVDEAILSGSPTIAGTRVPVRRLWAWHRGGAAVETLMKRYPQLGPAKVLDALSFAYDNEALVEADLAREQELMKQTGEKNEGARPMAQQALALDGAGRGGPTSAGGAARGKEGGSTENADLKRRLGQDWFCIHGRFSLRVRKTTRHPPTEARYAPPARVVVRTSPRSSAIRSTLCRSRDRSGDRSCDCSRECNAPTARQPDASAGPSLALLVALLLDRLLERGLAARRQRASQQRSTQSGSTHDQGCHDEVVATPQRKRQRLGDTSKNGAGDGASVKKTAFPR